MGIFEVLTMLGGLCLFLFGMNVMGESLERRAGSKLRDLLGKLTTNRFLGFLTGLGVGGGSLLMVWLTAVVGMDAVTARGINLLFYLPGAAAAIILRRKQGRIHWKHILSPAAAGCIAAWVCSRFSTVVENSWLQKVFGAALIAAGLREVLWKQKM